jgi:alpha-beta hydrolase superfamily lysophospholipase
VEYRDNHRDPVGQQLVGVRSLADRYRATGISSIAHEFYPGGRNEMLHELNRREVYSDLLVWMSGQLKPSS